MAKKTQTVYNVSFYTLTNKFIDQTQIDEKSDELAWQLFAEFGHTKEAGMYLDWEEEEEEMGED